MKPAISLLFLVGFFIHSAAQDFKEKELKTDIREVTVFLNAAQIFEEGAVPISAGTTVLRIKRISPYVDEKSIRVRADGDFTILSVNHKMNYLNEIKRDAETDSLKRLSEGIDAVLSKQNARLQVLKEKESLLNENKKLGGQNTGVSILQIKQAMDLFEAELSKITEEEIVIHDRIALKQGEKSKIEQQLKELNEQRLLPTSEIEIRVSSENPVTARFHVTYLVSNAGWYPKYDIRVENVKSPLELTYKAEVFQNTGVDWKNVKLRFSNGDPNQSGLVPMLNTWNLNYARNTVFESKLFGASTAGLIRNVKGQVRDESGLPIPGVNVMVKGTTIGTVSDGSGNYSLALPNGSTQLVFSFIGLQTEEVAVTQPVINMQLQPDATQLEEVVVTAYGTSGGDYSPSIRPRERVMKEKIITTTVIENQTTVEIEVQVPYTIKSNGEKLQVELRKNQIDALYEYYAVPKIDKDAFLVARVVNWDQYNLLAGEANLYFEDTYVGRSILDARALQDTLTISLGRDKNLVVGREKNEQFSKRKMIGGNVVETRGFKIVARNKKSQAVKLTIFDQIPKAVLSDIVVNAMELSKGQLEETTGKLKWELSLMPQQQKEIILQYEVRYPKRERVVLE